MIDVAQRKFRQDFPNLMKLNKIGEVWNSVNRFLSDFIGLLSSKNFATTIYGHLVITDSFPCPGGT